MNIYIYRLKQKRIIQYRTPARPAPWRQIPRRCAFSSPDAGAQAPPESGVYIYLFVVCIHVHIVAI